MRTLLLVLLVLTLGAPVAFAQTPVANPTTLEFNPSPDHSALSPVDGQPLVTRYDAKYYVATQCNPDCPTTTPTFTISLGKPTPVSGKIDVTNVFGGLVLDTVYKAVVVAVGPGGTSVNSNTSNSFGNRGPLATPATVSGVIVK